MTWDLHNGQTPGMCVPVLIGGLLFFLIGFFSKRRVRGYCSFASGAIFLPGLFGLETLFFYFLGMRRGY